VGARSYRTAEPQPDAIPERRLRPSSHTASRPLRPARGRTWALNSQQKRGIIRRQKKYPRLRGNVTPDRSSGSWQRRAVWQQQTEQQSWPAPKPIARQRRVSRCPLTFLHLHPPRPSFGGFTSARRTTFGERPLPVPGI